MSASMKWQTPEDFVKRKIRSRTKKHRGRSSPAEQSRSPPSASMTPSETISEHRQREEMPNDSDNNNNNNNNSNNYKYTQERSVTLHSKSRQNRNNNSNNSNGSKWIQKVKLAMIRMLENSDWIDNLNIASVAKYIWLSIGILVIAIIVCYFLVLLLSPFLLSISLREL